MKKLSKKHKCRQLRLIRKLKRKISFRSKKVYFSNHFNLKKSSHNRKTRKNKPNQIIPISTRLSKVQYFPTTKIITAPKIFDIQDKRIRTSVTQFISVVRESISNSSIKKVILDFTYTEKFLADATLLFYSEALYLKEMRNCHIDINYRPPIDDKASRVLHQIGFHELCGGKPYVQDNKDYEDVVHWRFAQGYNVDNSLCAPAIERYEGQLATPLLEGLFRGLGEAMTNTSHHAYLDCRDDNLNYKPPAKNWWMFSQARDKYLSVVFCDLGIGIPKTLPLTTPDILKRLLMLKKPIKDSVCIKKAVQHGLSRTNQPERGKGLGDIVEVVTKKKTGSILIYSNKGIYYKDETQEVTRDLNDSILGTLICWRVPLT